jgi:hypothetical protein
LIDDPSGRDRQHPELLVHQLESSYSGCDWLLDRWGALRAKLDRGRTWTPEDKLQAVTLLGKQVEHDDYELIMALAAEGDPKAKLTRQGLIDTYFDQPIPENQADHLAVLRAIVERTTSRLTLLLAEYGWCLQRGLDGSCSLGGHGGWRGRCSPRGQSDS